MTPRLTTSKSGRQLIKAFEGFRAKAAPLEGGGGWVVGFGHVKSARKGVEIGRTDAEKLLIYDLIVVEDAINDHVFAPLSQNQFDALASLAFNIGPQRFRRSAVARYLNEGRPIDAAAAFDDWRRGVIEGRAVIVDALARRRAAERALFLTPEHGHVAAPTPQVPVADAEIEWRAANEAVSVRIDLDDGERGAAYTVITPEAEPEAESPAAEPETVPAPEPDETPVRVGPTEEEAAKPVAPAAIAEERVEDVVSRILQDDDDEEPASTAEEAVESSEIVPEEAEAELEAERAYEDQLEREQQAGAEPLAEVINADPEPQPQAYIADRDSDLRHWRDLHARGVNEAKSSAGWYVLFLVIGLGMIGFGAYDSYLRWYSGQETLLYGPVLAGVGIIVALGSLWFLIRRIWTGR